MLGQSALNVNLNATNCAPAEMNGAFFADMRDALERSVGPVHCSVNAPPVAALISRLGIRETADDRWGQVIYLPLEEEGEGLGMMGGAIPSVIAVDASHVAIRRCS